MMDCGVDELYVDEYRCRGGMLLMFWLNQARWRGTEEEMAGTSATRSGNSSEVKRPTLCQENEGNRT